MPAAVTLFNSAVSLLQPDDPNRLTILPDLGSALIEVGRLEDAERILDEAIERGTACGLLRVVADALLFRFESELWAARIEEAGRSIDRARDLIAEGEAADDDLVQQRGWSVLGMWAPSVTDQTEYTLRAMRFAERAGDRKGLNENMQMMVGLLVGGPTPVEEALRIVDDYRNRTSGDPVMQAAVVVNGEAHLMAMAGRIDDAREAYRSARSTFSDLSLMLWLHADGTIGPSLAELRGGDPHLAVEMLFEGIEGLERIRAHGTWLVNELELLVRALVRLGRLADAEAAAVRLAELSRSYGDQHNTLVLNCRAQIAMLRGNAMAAVPLFRECLERMEQDWVVAVADVHVLLADALRQDGQRPEALETAHRALDIYRAKGDIVSARRVETFLDLG
jgi:tetratricopeptide (TPR) repeat protein